MLNYDKTIDVLQAFYEDCRAFWVRECANTREAHKRAVEDVERLSTNPFSPNGELLNIEAKAEFVAYTI